MSPLNNQFLNQVASFIKVAINLNEYQQDELFMMKKQAAIDEINKEKFRAALHKTANALYNSDFLTDEHEKRSFLKQAAEDPVYVVKFLEKVCEAADVAQIGKPARAAARPKEAEYDPVIARAFGYASGRDIIDD